HAKTVAIGIQGNALVKTEQYIPFDIASFGGGAVLNSDQYYQYVLTAEDIDRYYRMNKNQNNINKQTLPQSSSPLSPQSDHNISINTFHDPNPISSSYQLDSHINTYDQEEDDDESTLINRNKVARIFIRNTTSLSWSYIEQYAPHPISESLGEILEYKIVEPDFQWDFIEPQDFHSDYKTDLSVAYSASQLAIQKCAQWEVQTNQQGRKPDDSKSANDEIGCDP
ncbi:MAG: hypothetical protein EZS28_050042, partial [Streblomastix strix]